MAKGWLQGRTAVVTGAGRGIGRGVAILMAQEGANVIVNDPGVAVDGSGYDEGPAAEVVAEIKAAGGSAVANFDTVATIEGGESMIKQAIDSFGRIDIIVNNAGILRDRMVFNMTEEEWDDVVNVHLHGQFHLIRPASALMREQRWGRIINISSMSGLEGNSGQANYGSAKVGVVGLTRAIALELGPYGVTCNAVAAAGRTRLGQSVPGRAGQPLPTLPPGAGGPDDVAPMVCYLASDAAWNINGQSFRAAGPTVAILNNPQGFRGIQSPTKWTLADLDALMLKNVVAGAENPSPPPADLPVPGRPAAEPSAETPAT